MKKVVVISGGSDGLGKEIAKNLSANYTVVILAPSKEKLSMVARKIGCKFEVCDVPDVQSVTEAIKTILNKYRRIDCMINNAGIWIEGELDVNKLGDIKRAIDINIMGTIYLCRAVIPQMKNQRGGLIINIISQAGLYGKAERSVYNASKFAITGLTKSLQPELAKYGIAITGIYPGKMRTKLFEKVGVTKSMDNALNPSEVAKTIEFLLSFPKEIVFTEIGIKNIND